MSQTENEIQFDLNFTKVRVAKGKFISFEGGEGGGKTTQINLLTKALKPGVVLAIPLSFKYCIADAFVI